MYQFYILEIQQYADGTFGHLVHYAYDENADKARLKAEAKYHQVLSAAAVSNLPSHSATIIAQDGFPVMHQCYKHDPEPEPAPTPEPDPDADAE